MITTASADATTTKSQAPCADLMAGEASQMAPAVVGKDQQDSDRSFCGSENGISSKSGNSKARVSKVTRRHPQVTSSHVETTSSPSTSTELANNLLSLMSKVRNEMRVQPTGTLEKSEEEPIPFLV